MVTVICDPTHLHQILMNLCRNASEAMAGEDGTIKVAVRPSGQDRVDRSVEDDGPGMSEEIRKHLFEPFFTTKPLGKGLGLGLAIVFGLVDEMNGTIGVGCDPGEGTSFRISLPRVSQSAAEAATIVHAMPRGNDRIILIDDKAEVAVTLRRILSRLRNQPQAVTGPMVALACFSKAPGDFDSVVSDMMMPDLNGEDRANEIRSLRPRNPGLFCSAYKPENLDITGPLSWVLAKPTAPMVLATAVRALR